jgi:hypothetical protein
MLVWKTPVRQGVVSRCNYYLQTGAGGADARQGWTLFAATQYAPSLEARMHR